MEYTYGENRFLIDFDKTKEYYETHSLCDCEDCQSFYARVNAESFPRLAELLSGFGARIDRPDELSSFPLFDKTEYETAAYTVCGRVTERKTPEITLEDGGQTFSIVFDDAYAPNEQQGEYFVIGVHGIALPNAEKEKKMEKPTFNAPAGDAHEHYAFTLAPGAVDAVRKHYCRRQILRSCFSLFLCLSIIVFGYFYDNVILGIGIGAAIAVSVIFFIAFTALRTSFHPDRAYDYALYDNDFVITIESAETFYKEIIPYAEIKKAEKVGETLVLTRKNLLYMLPLSLLPENSFFRRTAFPIVKR